MNVLNQFVESSIAVSEQIALMMQENERLKKRVAELEKPEPKPEPHIYDLMPIGETFCGLKVVDHDRMPNRVSRQIAISPCNDESEWINDSTARAIYEEEMELRELRRMKPVVEAVKQWVIDDVSTASPTKISETTEPLYKLMVAYREYKSESEQ